VVVVAAQELSVETVKGELEQLLRRVARRVAATVATIPPPEPAIWSSSLRRGGGRTPFPVPRRTGGLRVGVTKSWDHRPSDRVQDRVRGLVAPVVLAARPDEHDRGSFASDDSFGEDSRAHPGEAESALVPSWCGHDRGALR